MPGSCRPGPVCCTTDGFDAGTMSRAQSSTQGPVCSYRIEDMIAEGINQSTYTAPVHPVKRLKPKHRHHKKPEFAKPDAKVMAAINKELGTNINFDKLADFEGGQSLKGYIPGHTLGVKDDVAKVAGKSGVTVATGFDIGQWTVSDLSQKLGLPDSLQKKYKRFCSKPKQLAIDELEKEGLSVTKLEADQTDLRVQRYHLVAAMATWDDDPKPSKKFVDLTMAQQTVVLSRTYHQGIGMPETAVAQDFYNAAQKGDWVAAEKALRKYHVKQGWYKVRVSQEADYLAEDLRAQRSAAPKAGPAVPRR